MTVTGTNGQATTRGGAREEGLRAMLEARSVAVVGASARPGSFGEMMMIQLTRSGFDGAVHPVNPNHDDVFGYPCVSEIGQIPEPVDLAILGVPNHLLEAQLAGAARAGARSAVIFASCHEPAEPGRPPLGERLAAIAGDAGMSLCGGNGMGFVNVERGLRACGFSEPQDLEPGGIAFVSHSGSAFSAMLHNGRGLRFNVVVSSGLELVTTTDQYLEHVLRLPSTRAVALFIETVRRPAAFRAALALAFDHDVPVVALKVGREGAARAMVAAHSGALAGEDGAFEALFDAHGVIRVQSLDEMADTLELLTARRRASAGGLAAVHDSGGERVHLIDAAASAGVGLAEISDGTKARLAAVLEDGLPAVNPLDAWGTGNDADRIFAQCMHALLDDPDTAALAFCVDLTTEPAAEGGYVKVAAEAFAGTTKPMAVLSNLASAIDPRDAASLRSAGVPVLEGTVTGLAAFRHLFDHRDHRARPPVIPPDGPPDEVRRRWRTRLAEGSALPEVEGLALVADYGVPVVRTEAASNVDEALDAAAMIGWPVALKSARPGLTHKTEAGGVRLRLRGQKELWAAYMAMEAELGSAVTVSAMAPAGTELALGVVNDPQFGPLVMVAAGGVLVEVLRDRRFGLPPLDRARALAMVDRLAVRPVLDGVRGAAAANLDSVAEAIVRLSALASDVGDLIEALDVNPLIAGPEGCVAVDALVVPVKGGGG